MKLQDTLTRSHSSVNFICDVCDVCDVKLST